MSSEEEDCLTLDTLSAEDIRTIARNPKYKQLLNELVESHRSADSEANEGKRTTILPLTKEVWLTPPPSSSNRD